MNLDAKAYSDAWNNLQRLAEDKGLLWHTRWNADQTLPHAITVGIGETHRIAGFTYLPRQDGTINGTAEKFRFETSGDDADWVTNIAAGSCANIQNNPSLHK